MFSRPDFPMLTAEQANPWHTGINWSNQLLQQALANKQNQALAQQAAINAKYAEPTAQQALQKAQLLNQIAGVQAKYAEPSAQEELRKAQLYNQFYGPNIQSEMAARGAQANLARQHAAQAAYQLSHPGLMYGGDAAQLEYLKGLGGKISPEQLQTLVAGQVEAPLTNVQYKQSLSKAIESNIQGKGFTTMPPNVKAAAIATLRGAGYNDTEATNALLSGQDIGNLLEAKGFNRGGSDVVPVYAPTAGTQSQQQRANIAQAGIGAIEPDIAKDLAPYARKWNGTSLGQLRDSLSGSSDEKVGRAIGAGAMAQELSMLRLRAAGAPVGITAIRESLDASKTRLHTPDLSLTPKQFEIAQSYISEQINKLNKAENKALYPSGGKSGKETSSLNMDLSHLSDEELRRIAGGK